MITSTESAINAAYTSLACNLPESIRPILLSELERIANVARGEQAMVEHDRRVESTRYNGWINRETWLVGLWWNECPIERIKADDRAEGVESLAEQLEELFDECHPNPSHALECDLYQGAVCRIDWREIAEHWIGDIDLVLPETEEEVNA